MIIKLLPSKHIGILHLSGQPISKYDFIQKVAKFVKYETNKVVPISMEDYPLKAPRPKNTSLSSKIDKNILNTPIPSIDEWLNDNQNEIIQLIK